MGIIKNNLLIYFLVFSVFFGIFYFLQFSFPNLACPDGYYHIKQAWLIRTQGIEKTVKEFPWLQCSIFKDHPGDLWFGYHLLLIPFTFGDLIFGAKLASVFFSTLLFLVFFWILRKFKIKYAFFWTFFLLLMTWVFTFRLLLPRPFILSILFSLLGFYFIFNKKYLAIFITSLFYGFTVTESPLIILIATSFLFLEWFEVKKIDLKPLALSIAGVAAALIIRPDFPNNIYLIFYQFFGVIFLKTV